jgi:cyclopropane fatty-acyl-phospholipid synthase-like methyltransferase
LKKLFKKYHEKWAFERISIFKSSIKLAAGSSILDLGGYDGAFMDRFKLHSANQYKILIADLSIAGLNKAKDKGYEVRIIDASKDQFPFRDQEFDCIFCNSVIEHVTIPKDEIWQQNNNFKSRSFQIQKHFANEIIRCSKTYFVQTPHKMFPIEAHTWFPFISYFPRRLQINAIKILNKFWYKKTTPDWNLLDEFQMKELFPDAEIRIIKKFGFKKEIIAIKST